MNITLFIHVLESTDSIQQSLFSRLVTVKTGLLTAAPAAVGCEYVMCNS